MLSKQYAQAFPISPGEATYFGWFTLGENLPLVLATRTPSGKIIIPTRELIDGQFNYGFVETHEIIEVDDLDPWEDQATAIEKHRPGLLM